MTQEINKYLLDMEYRLEQIAARPGTPTAPAELARIKHKRKMTLEEITEIVEVEIAKNREILRLFDKDLETFFIRESMKKAEKNVREGK